MMENPYNEQSDRELHSMIRNDSFKSILNGGIVLCAMNDDRRGYEGSLPSNAPLANAFVPFQKENPPMYEARKGLIRGTMYPGLDLPFMGMVNKKEKNVTPMTELQTLGFAIQELALYLDTHREDKEAFDLYQTYQKLYHQGMQQYVENIGPLNHAAPAKGSYRWLDDPWPWEFAANKEA
jgi:spore coat protein JB